MWLLGEYQDKFKPSELKVINKENRKLMALYPQIMSLDRDTEGNAGIITSTTTQSTTPTKATVVKRLQEHREESLKSRPSFKDTKEFKSLIAQFNNNFKSPWSQEEGKRKREQQFEANRAAKKTS